GGGKVAKVPRTFPRRAAAVVHDVNRRVVEHHTTAQQGATQGEVFEVEEVALVKTAHCLQRGAAAQHEAAAQMKSWHRFLGLHHGLAFITRQATGEKASQPPRCKATQSEIQNSDITLA